MYDLCLVVQQLSKAIISDEKRLPITRSRGRPMKDIMQEQLKLFNIVDMSLLFDCFRRTIKRRIKDYGLVFHNCSLLRNLELDSLVTKVVRFLEKNLYTDC